MERWLTLHDYQLMPIVERTSTGSRRLAQASCWTAPPDRSLDRERTLVCLQSSLVADRTVAPSDLML